MSVLRARDQVVPDALRLAPPGDEGFPRVGAAELRAVALLHDLDLEAVAGRVLAGDLPARRGPHRLAAGR